MSTKTKQLVFSAAAIALARALELFIDDGRMVGAGHGTVAATDAFGDVGPDKPRLIAMHGPCGAYLGAGGAGAMVAGQRNVIGEGVLGNGSVLCYVPVAALVVEHAAKSFVGPMVVVVLAGHDAGPASSAARVIEEKSLRHGLQVPSNGVARANPCYASIISEAGHRL